MQYKPLGRSGLLVSDLGLGTMIFGDESSRGTPEDEAIRMIHLFLDRGGNHLDTADVYGGGRSEEMVGKAIKARRDDVILATKVRVPTGDTPNQQGLSRHHILRSVESSLRRLQTDYLDIYYVHAWDNLTPVDETMRVLDDLVTAGKVRYLGISNFKAWQLMKALSVSDSHGWNRFVAAQYQYSLVQRDIEFEFVELCQNEGLGLIPWGPLGGGFLTGKYRRDERPTRAEQGRIGNAQAEWEEVWERRSNAQNWAVLDIVEEIAAARNATYPQVALAWLRAKEIVCSVILGARTMAQLEDNLGAADIELTADEIAQLTDAFQLAELYPYRMMQLYAYRDRKPTYRPVSKEA